MSIRKWRHPLTSFVLTCFESHTHLDGPKLAPFIGGATVGETVGIYTTVAKDVLDCMVEDDLVERDSDGWYVLKSE